MKLIPLTQDRFAIVDDEDFKWLSQFNWYYHRNKTGKHGYAVGKKTGRIVRMHREILYRHGLLKFGMEVDHQNDCGTDNRKENLRVATQNENSHNRGKQRTNTSGTLGVHWHKQAGKWQAYIMLNGKQKHLGYFDNIKDAREARTAAEKEFFKEFRYDPTNVCPLGYTGQCPDCAARLRKLNEITN